MAGNAPSGAPAGRRRRGRPPVGEGPSTRQRILDAAQLRFGELGFHGLSVEQLARELGVDARTVYHYFPSKSALFKAAADAAFEQSLVRASTTVLAHHDARGRLHGLVDFYRSAHRDTPHLVPFFATIIVESIAAARGAAPPDRPAAFAADDIATLGQPVRAVMGMLAEDAVRRGDLDPSVAATTASVLLQVIVTGLGLASLDPEAPFPALLDALDLLIDGDLFR